MDKPGRKNDGDLAVIVNIPGQRPEPPEILSSLERAVWKRIVSTRPHDWFTPENFPLLVQYCRWTVAADFEAEELAKFNGIPEGNDEFTRWLRLTDRHDKTARLLATLATKMRLTQQAHWTHKTSDTAIRKTAAKRPWETDADAG